MPSGTLEVLLVGAKDLEETGFFTKMDPYVLLSLRTQEKKSTVIEGKGSEPEWNETFVFTVTSDDVTELNLKIMDKDTFSSDDFVGEANIPLEPVFMEGNLPPTSYSVVNEDKEYHGEITVGLTFTPERTSPRAEDYGGNGGSYGDSRRSHGDSRGERYDDDSRGGYGDDSRGGYGDDSRRGRRDSRERYGDDDSGRGYGDSGECYGEDTRRGYGDSGECYGEDTRRGYCHSREGYDDDDSRGGYGDSRGSRGGWKESSRCEEESYGGYKESSYRG